MAEETTPGKSNRRKQYVRPPHDPASSTLPTRDELLELGRRLFDRIQCDRLDPDNPDNQGEPKDADR